VKARRRGKDVADENVASTAVTWDYVAEKTVALNHQCIFDRVGPSRDGPNRDGLSRDVLLITLDLNPA
jgi:hypothetical protein